MRAAASSRQRQNSSLSRSPAASASKALRQRRNSLRENSHSLRESPLRSITFTDDSPESSYLLHERPKKSITFADDSSDIILRGNSNHELSRSDFGSGSRRSLLVENSRNSSWLVVSDEIKRPLSKKEMQQKKQKKKEKQERRLTRRASQAMILKLSIEENPSQLCDSFDRLDSPEDVLFGKKIKVGFDQHVVPIASKKHGKTIGTVFYSHTGRRILRDGRGGACAVIVDALDVYTGKTIFTIYGKNPVNEKHQMSNLYRGYYKWATVKNCGEFKPKFSLDILETSSYGEAGRFKAKYDKKDTCSWFQSRQELTIYNKGGLSAYIAGDIYEECSKLTIQGDMLELLVEEDMDLGLMICYAAIISEMIEKRLF